jgi:hypothetical protein
MDKPTEDGFSNAFWNVLQPFTLSGKAFMGSASYVAIETTVGQIIRRIMKQPYNIAESMETHTLSVPFLGQMNFGEPYKNYPENSKAKIDFVESVTEGAKAIPAAIVGYTAMKLRREGMRVPSYANRDFIYMLVGKLLSRPLTDYIFQSLPEDIEIGLTILNTLSNTQHKLIRDMKAQKGSSAEEDL